MIAPRNSGMPAESCQPASLAGASSDRGSRLPLHIGLPEAKGRHRPLARLAADCIGAPHKQHSEPRERCLSDRVATRRADSCRSSLHDRHVPANAEPPAPGMKVPMSRFQPRRNPLQGPNSEEDRMDFLVSRSAILVSSQRAIDRSREFAASLRIRVDCRRFDVPRAGTTCLSGRSSAQASYGSSELSSNQKTRGPNRWVSVRKLPKRVPDG